MTTNFKSDLEIPLIETNPANPRRNARADKELIDSVKISGLVQPLVVAPVAPPEGYEGTPERGYSKPGTGVWMQRYVLIAGHRRLDALKKTKAKTAPAIVRTDLVTEGQQIEAMLVENGRRADLSPVEEAEGYHQLELLGYKPQAIASAVGRDVKTVKSRLKLLTLSPSTQKKVHEGQFTLDDAAAFAEFADDKDATRRLEQAAKAGQLKYAITRERQTRQRLQELHAVIAALADAGATEYTLAKDAGLYTAPIRVLRYSATADDAALASEHEGCFGYVADLAGSYPTVHTVCINPDSHRAADENEDDDAQQSEWDRQREERLRVYEEERAAKAAAAKTRADTVLALFGTDTRMPPALRDVVRALLPTVMYDTAVLGSFPDLYFELVGVPTEDRWDNLNYADVDATRFVQHVEDIDRWSDGILTRALVALLVAIADANAGMTDDYGPAEKLVIGRYLNLLTEAGHEFCDVDQQLRDALTAAEDAGPEDVAS